MESKRKPSLFEYSGLLVALLLYFFPAGQTMRCVALSIGLLAVLHYLWTAEWSIATKINCTTLLVAALVVAGSKILFLPPSYIYLIVSRDLGENNANALSEMIPRRAFVIRQEGSEVLHNVTVTVHDSRGIDQMHNDYIEIHSEIDPGPLNSFAEPLHFWLRPTKPWDEDYTVALEAREISLNEHIIVNCLDTDALFAVRVIAAGKGTPLLSCRDEGISADISEWKNDTPKSCQSVIPTGSTKFEALLAPRPFVLSSPKELIDMTPHIYTDNRMHLLGHLFVCQHRKR